MQKLKWIAVTVAVGLLAILLLQNTEPVQTRVLFTSFTMPRAALLLTTAVLGFICGVVLVWLVHSKTKKK